MYLVNEALGMQFLHSQATEIPLAPVISFSNVFGLKSD